MGLRFRSEFETISKDYYKIEIHDSSTTTYGPDLCANPQLNGIANGTDVITPYSIGDFVGGGYVFDIDSDGVHYIVQNNNVTPKEWGCMGTVINSTSSLIGTGKANTEAIVSQCSGTQIAARSPYDSTSNGYTDWYLPSRGELSQLYNQKSTLEAITGFTPFATGATYWSSSQYTADEADKAWAKDFSTGQNVVNNKDSDNYVRGIRSFIPFGPFVANNTPFTREVNVSSQTNYQNQYSAIKITADGSSEGFRFIFSASANKKYELEFSSYSDPAEVYIYGTSQQATGVGFGTTSDLNGETRIQIESTANQTISIFFYANNAAVGTTFFKNVRIREVLLDVIEFDLRGSDGFKLAYSGSDLTYDLIKPSTLNFTINVTNSSLEQLAKDIASSPPERFSIRVYRADLPTQNTGGVSILDKRFFYELYWFGYINKVVMSIKDMPYPFDLNIAAVDGILDLKGKDYKDSEGVGFVGKKSIKEILCQILQKIDVANVYDDLFDQALLTQVNWIEDSQDDTKDVCVQTWLHVDPFTTATDDGRINFSSYYDVLESICRLFQARFLLSDGRFSFVQYYNQDESSITPYIYTKTGRDDGSFPATSPALPISKIYGETTTNSVSLQSADARGGFFERTKKFGNKITNIQIPFAASVNAGNILPANNVFPLYDNIGASNYGAGWLNVGPDLFGSWEANDNITFEFTIKFSVTVYKKYGVTPNTPDANNDFNGKIYIPIYLLAKSENGNRYWKPSNDLSPTNTFEDEGSWVNSTSILDNAVIVKSSNLFIYNNSIAGTEQQTVEVTFSTSAANVHDFDSVHLYVNGFSTWKYQSGGGENAWWGIQQSGSPYVGRLEDIDEWQGYEAVLSMDNISLNVFQNGEKYIDYVTESSVGTLVNSNQNNPELLVVKDIIWGDGPNTLPIKAVWTGLAPVQGAVSQTDNWQIDGTGASYKIHQLIADQILSNNYLSAEVLQAKIVMPTSDVFTSSNIYWRVYPFMGFERKFVDGSSVLNTENYSFSSMTYSPNLNEWSFKGKKIGLPAPTVDSDIVYLGTGVVSEIAPTNTAGNISQNTNNEIAKLDQSVSPSSGALTSLAVTALPVNIPSGTVIQIESSGSTGVWEQVVLSADAAVSATAISINSWTPSYSFLTGTPLIVTTGAIFAASTQAAGSDTQVQYNNSGELAGSSGLTFNDGTGTLTATAFSGPLTGNVDAVDIDATGTATVANIVSSGSVTLSGLNTSTPAQSNVIGIDASGNLYEQPAGTGGGGTPAGNHLTIQYNNNGSFAGDNNFKIDPTNVKLIVGGKVKSDNLESGDFPIGTTTYGATGAYAFAQGSNTTASGGYAVALNNTTTASALDSVAMGENSVASGRQSLAGGYECTASGAASFAFGALTTASGERAVCFGANSLASGEDAVVMGFNHTALGDRTLTIGYENVNRASNGFVMGQDNTLNNLYANGDSGAGTGCFVGGYNNVVRVNDSIIFGSLCNAGVNSAGDNNSKNQFLFGLGLNVPKNNDGNAAGQSQTVVGRYNADFEVGVHKLFSVGNGQSDASRTDAFTVTVDGNVGIGNIEPAYQLQLSSANAYKSSGSTWLNPSDERIKTNIRSYDKGLEDVIKIEPKIFDFNGKAGTNSDEKDNIGIIAQEIQEAFPETIRPFTAKLNKEDDEKTDLLAFDSTALTYALINSVKELNAEVQALRKELNELKNK